MPTGLKTLYKTNGSTIKTTILRGTPTPPPPKRQPECTPLATVDTNARLDYTFDCEQWEIEEEEWSGLLDSEDHKPRRLHQV
jgi:hypothetical protein